MVAVDPSQFSLDFITQHIYNDKAKKDGIPRNWGIEEAFVYENTRNDFKCCNYPEK